MGSVVSRLFAAGALVGSGTTQTCCTGTLCRAPGQAARNEHRSAVHFPELIGQPEFMST
jgi:hypothetical protein